MRGMRYGGELGGVVRWVERLADEGVRWVRKVKWAGGEWEGEMGKSEEMGWLKGREEMWERSG